MYTKIVDQKKHGENHFKKSIQRKQETCRHGKKTQGVQTYDQEGEAHEKYNEEE